MAVVSDAGLSRKAESANFPLRRFEDLRAQRIVQTWTSLNKWIDEKGFPPGRIIGRFRTWTQAEVLAWVERQPSDKVELRGFAKQRASNGRARP
jgi:hypothetical protein